MSEQSPLPDFTARQLCIHCKGGECADNAVEEDAMVLCDCCLDHGAHLKCLRKNGEPVSSEEVANPSFVWFCSEACKRVATGLVEATNQRRPLEKKAGIYTSEIIRYSEKYRASQNVVGTVVSMFHSAFGPSLYADGSDLVELVCKGANHSIPDVDKDEQPPDCSNFLNFILRKGGNIVAAAVIRAHGTLLAEIPFVVTREGYRREGNCKRLLSALEKTLNDLGVQWLVVPAANITVPIWKEALGFKEASADAIEQLEERIIVPDDTKILLRKIGCLPLFTAAGKKRKLKRVRFSLPSTAFESTSDSSDNDDDDNPKAKKRSKRSKKKDSDDEEEFTIEAAEAELEDDDDEEEEEAANGGSNNGCSQCGAISDNALHEDEATGDLLCSTCLTARDGGASGSGAAAQHGGKACYHCGTDEEIKLQKHKDSGGWECITCKRYRATHNGELRPARLFTRKARPRAAPPAGAAVGGGSAGASGSMTVAIPANQQQQTRVQNPRFSSVRATNAAQTHQKRAFRLHERFCAQPGQLLKHVFIPPQRSNSVMNTINNTYNIKSLANGSNQVAIEILSAKKVDEEATAWGDVRLQMIKADAKRQLAEDNNTAAQQNLEEERQKRAKVEAHLESVLEKMKLMKEEASKHKELIANLEKTAQFAAAAPLAPLPAANPAAAAAAPLDIPEEKQVSEPQIESLLVERSMEDLINDLGGAFSPDDDDADEVAGGGGYRCSLLLLQNKARSTPLQNLNKPATKTASPMKQHSCSSVEKQASPGATAVARAAAPLQSGPVNSTVSEENTPPADADVSALKTADEGGGLFTLFRGLASTGGGGKDGETSGDTMMDDNDSKSNTTSPAGTREGGDGDGVIKERNVNDVMEIDVGGGGAFMKRESLGLDGPEPFQSQGSMN